MGFGGASSMLKKAAKKMVVAACGSLSSSKPPSIVDSSLSANITGSRVMSSTKTGSCVSKELVGEEAESTAVNNDTNNLASKNVCAICLEALSFRSGNSPGQAIFMAQCSHAFHFTCIASNVRHGSVTCPICRAHWTQLPRNLNPPCALSCNQTDPILRILDDSIANFRVHRRCLLLAARYDDDDPVEPDHATDNCRLDFSLAGVQPTNFCHPYRHHSSLQAIGHGSHCYKHHHHLLTSSLFLHQPSSYICTSSENRRATSAYLSVKFAHPRATDLVLVASPNGPHLRLLKQSMALVVFSLRPIDRLAIVTYSSSAARVFPLRRMTSYGKKTALQVIERLFYMGQADPAEGLKKGIKILEDRVHKNPWSCILHLLDSPTRSYQGIDTQIPIPVHRFHVGLSFGASNGFVMHEFEDYLARLLGGIIRDVELRVGEEGRIIRLGELRGNEERRILVDINDSTGYISVAYSYIEGEINECRRTGETMVAVEDKSETREETTERTTSLISGRASSVESWDYHDPYMARRWAKHLHNYRL